MKLTNETEELISSTSKKQSQFTIQASTKAFSILSDKLYSNKILAVIREYVANAFDAHLEADNKIMAPQVIIPSEVHPVFSIRDYGVGLSDEDVESLFCTYFASNKTHTNNFIGGFGLGCKAAFSYADTFSVTSWFNGTKTQYTMVMLEGQPTCLTGTKKQTDEPNGLMISVPVTDDYSTWCQTIAEVFKYYPKWFISKDIDSLILRTLREYPKNTLLKSEAPCSGILYGYSYIPSPRNIPINISQSLIYITKTGVQFEYRSYGLKFDVGEIDVTPSREQLDLNDRTIAALKAKHNERQKEFEEYCKRNLADFNYLTDTAPESLKVSFSKGFFDATIYSYLAGNSLIQVEDGRVTESMHGDKCWNRIVSSCTSLSDVLTRHLQRYGFNGYDIILTTSFVGRKYIKDNVLILKTIDEMSNASLLNWLSSKGFKPYSSIDSYLFEKGIKKKKTNTKPKRKYKVIVYKSNDEGKLTRYEEEWFHNDFVSFYQQDSSYSYHSHQSLDRFIETANANDFKVLPNITILINPADVVPVKLRKRFLKKLPLIEYSSKLFKKIYSLKDVFAMMVINYFNNRHNYEYYSFGMEEKAFFGSLNIDGDKLVNEVYPELKYRQSFIDLCPILDREIFYQIRTLLQTYTDPLGKLLFTQARSELFPWNSVKSFNQESELFDSVKKVIQQKLLEVLEYIEENQLDYSFKY